MNHEVRLLQAKLDRVRKMCEEQASAAEILAVLDLPEPPCPTCVSWRRTSDAVCGDCGSEREV